MGCELGGARTLAAAGSEGRARIAAHFFDSAVAEDAALPLDEQRRRAEDARAFVRALAQKIEGRDRTVARLMLQRYLRLSLVVAVLAGAASACMALHAKLVARHDFAADKPFATSSSFDDPDFNPVGHTVLHGTVPLLFHTNEEVDPWVELDLGASSRVDSVEVVNRADCCTDRAVPLIVEVSLDHEHYEEVARRTESFSAWQASFAARDVRWVKLHVPRRTWLHLERVSVYGP